MPMLRKLRHQMAKSPARTPLVWIRHKTLKSSDLFLASYPRSGSTWLRFLLFESLVGRSSGFQNVNLAIPDVKAHKVGLPFLPGEGRLIKTHEVYHPEYRKAIYLVRDPRDVALSEYAYQTALGLVDLEFDQYLNEFLTRGVNPFASWRSHVESWLSAPLNHEQLLIVRFEDLRKDTFHAVAEIARFMGLVPDENRIRNAIAQNTVDRMRAKEKATPQRASQNGRFIGSGSVGGWRATLDPAQVQLFSQQTGALLERMRYPLAAEPAEALVV